MLAYRIRVPHGNGVDKDAVETTSDSALAIAFLTKFQEQHKDDLKSGFDDALLPPTLSVYEAEDGEKFTLNSVEDVIGVIEANY